MECYGGYCARRVAALSGFRLIAHAEIHPGNPASPQMREEFLATGTRQGKSEPGR
jgi:hypothetical protein